MKILYGHHPDDVKHYTTEQLRDQFLIETVFSPDTISLTYSHVDRIIFGGAMPVKQTLKLEAGDELRAAYFLERRELGAINIGGDGVVSVDGAEYPVKAKEAVYIGMGSREISFTSVDATKPAKFYINSCPAHRTCETRVIRYDDAIHKELGEQKTINRRTLNQYIHPDVCDSCQLCMGMTELHEGSSWNSMPCHTHERRMEVYFYFNLPDDARLFHMMGEPQQTRHLVVANEQAVVSPSWSIHCGCATSSYTFIWGMCGENKDFDDMDHILTADLK